jgi:uncharacterized membrane protein (DUF4010 family)
VCVCDDLGLNGLPPAFPGVLLVIGGLLAISHYVDALKRAVGLTTDVAVLLTVVTGGLVYWGEVLLAVAIGVATAVLLSIKVEAQRFVKHLNQEDIVAALQFAVITAIILPLVPNETLGPPPFDVLNPFTIWLLVVLISGISFIGYVLNKVLGASRGIGLTGLVGGLASSTAVTLTFAQRSREEGKLARPMALGITLASTVMFVRVLVEAAVVNPALVSMLWIPIALRSWLDWLIAFIYSLHRSQHEEDVKLSNPFDLAMAIKFGVAFTVIFLIARAAQIYFGDAGIYVSSILSGLVGVDAIVLSLAELSRGQILPQPFGDRTCHCCARHHPGCGCEYGRQRRDCAGSWNRRAAALYPAGFYLDDAYRSDPADAGPDLTASGSLRKFMGWRI